MADRTVPGPARTPEALHAIIADAFTRGDLDAYLAAFEDGATIVVPPEGQVVHGRAEIRDSHTKFFALRPRMTIAVQKKVEGDGLALSYGRWELVGTDADGNATELNGFGTMVSRRQPDGTWRIVLDDPMRPV